MWHLVSEFLTEINLYINLWESVCILVSISLSLTFSSTAEKSVIFSSVNSGSDALNKVTVTQSDSGNWDLEKVTRLPFSHLHAWKSFYVNICHNDILWVMF